MRAYKKPGRPPCTVDGCVQPLYCKGFCVMHYSRSRKGGPVDRSERIRATRGGGSVIADGYRILRRPSHPLARAQGKVPEHRAVLYDAIGPGPHSCHWCGKTIYWDAAAAERINTDHLDWNRLNNDAANLVPACLDCNTKRRRAA